MAVSPLILGAVVTGALILAIAIYIEYLEDWRSYTVGGTEDSSLTRQSEIRDEEDTDAIRDDVGAGAGAGSDVYTYSEKPSGIIRWLTTVDHKDIGILYGVFAILAFAVAGIMAVLIRIQLIVPGGAIVGTNFYNSILTSHGITMLFLFGTPILAAFSNYFVPLLIGADDMAFPRINAIAFWLLPPGALLIWAGFFLAPLTGNEIAPSQLSWTMYAPQSVERVNPGADLMLLGLHLTGISTTMGAINFIATIISERGESVTWANLDIFSWTVLTQSGIILFAFPLLGSALIMLLLDRNFGTSFFLNPGGGPLLWQHLFWFFGHPEVYILVLPPMGLISYILPRFAGRRLFGFRFVVYSTLAIGVLSFGVWAHHMFATVMDPQLAVSFMAVSLAIAIPSAVKTFNWITTMWNGKLRLTAPMLFCIGFVSNFIIGGVTGVFLASIPVDYLLTDTYYVVGHFHYIVMGAIGFAVFAGIYYWFPIFTGRMYQRRLAKWHFWLSMIGTNLTFFAMLALGYIGMPRRYATYTVSIAPQLELTLLHQIASVGALILLFSTVIFVWNIVQSWKEGRVVEDDDPWNLRSSAPTLTNREFRWFRQQPDSVFSDGGKPADTAESEHESESTTENHSD